MWKLVDTSSKNFLVNQAENWNSKDNWEFKENGAFISIQNISKNQVIPIVLTIDADSDKIKEAELNGRKIAAFLSEPFFAIGGVFVPPQSYFSHVYRCPVYTLHRSDNVF